MSISETESKTFLSDKDDEAGKSFLSGGGSKASKRSTKSKIKRKFGLSKNKEKKKRNAEEELNKVNDNFWPIGDRSFTGSEKMAIACGSLAVCLGLGSVLVVAGAGLGPIATATGMVAGGLTAVTMPHAIYNQAALTKLETFRDVVNAMRGEVNNFADTNKDLHNNIDALENHVEG